MQRSTIRRVVLALGAAVALGVGAVFVYPALTSPSRAPEGATPAGTDWCAEHQVKESRCPFCNPDLIESDGFCGGHGVPEALCTRCRADIIPAFRAQGDWCAEHALPESQCEQCNPGALDRYRKEGKGGKTGAAPASGDGRTQPPLAKTASEPQAKDPAAAVADLPRSQRPPSVTCTSEQSSVRLASAALAADAGIEVAAVRRERLRQTIRVTASVEYDPARLVRLTARAAGVVTDIRVRLGASVKAGDTLAVVDSSELGTARSELLQALAAVRLWQRNHERERALREQALGTERAAIEAETELELAQIAVARAEQRLRNFGLDDAAIAEARHSGATSSMLPVKAPFDGVVVELGPARGTAVDATVPLVAVADLSVLHALLDVPQSELALLREGQPVVLTIDGLPGETFAGELLWVGSEVDRRTRLVRARAMLQNPQGLLKANAFGRAEIATRAGEEVLLVPKAAVQWDGCCNVAFVPTSASEFRPRKLRLGHAAGIWQEVLAGLSDGDQVVTQGSFLLKTELQKGSIGAGCCEVDHLAK